MNNELTVLNNLSRRNFLRASAVAAAAAAASLPQSAGRAASSRAPKGGLIAKGDVVLFQGDSITDAGRARDKGGAPNEQPGLGNGYAWLAAAELLVARPGDSLKIYNRGISGNKVYQLAERWQADCLDLKPNVLSILIGVNDLWHKLNGDYQGTIETYEHDYRELVERTRKALPKVKLVICEPFVLRTGAVTDKWFPEFDGFRAAARRVADANKALFIPFQSMFDEALKYAPAGRWAKDGVHPSSDGASLMAHTWSRLAAGL